MNEKWNESELKAAVEAYLDMYEKEAKGKPFTKKHYYEQLAEKWKRTEKSFEYRMQNISYVFSLIGRDWVSGLKPAKNVEAAVAKTIEKLIYEVEGSTYLPIAEFETQVNIYLKQSKISAPTGVKEPKKAYSSINQYERDPKVKAWILKEAKGACESCLCKAPFFNSNDEPYLEVHHIKSLSDSGSDTITNAVALCPNCHREIHYGKP